MTSPNVIVTIPCLEKGVILYTAGLTWQLKKNKCDSTTTVSQMRSTQTTHASRIRCHRYLALHHLTIHNRPRFTTSYPPKITTRKSPHRLITRHPTSHRRIANLPMDTVRVYRGDYAWGLECRLLLVYGRLVTDQVSQAVFIAFASLRRRDGFQSWSAIEQFLITNERFSN